MVDKIELRELLKTV